MNIKRWLQTESLSIFLIVSMILTRYHHFGDALHLPDASLVVFFFAGFYRKKALLGFLLVLAGLIDVLAIKNGTSAWCVSPAYVFLIPTYATMWLAGRYCVAFKALQFIELIKTVGLLVLATSMAFVISNVSFYGLSGRFDAMSLIEYAERVAQYYPTYVGSALVYGVIGFAVVKLIKLLPQIFASHKAI